MSNDLLGIKASWCPITGTHQHERAAWLVLRRTAPLPLTCSLAGTRGLIRAVLPWGEGPSGTVLERVPPNHNQTPVPCLEPVTSTRSQPEGPHICTQGTDGSLTLTDVLTRRHVRSRRQSLTTNWLFRANSRNPLKALTPYLPRNIPCCHIPRSQSDTEPGTLRTGRACNINHRSGICTYTPSLPFHLRLTALHSDSGSSLCSEIRTLMKQSLFYL